jgi:aspartate/glutamate racemase
MPDIYKFEFTTEELKLIVQNLTEASQRWRTIASESPFPDAAEASRTEWLSLIRILERLEAVDV